MSNNVNSIREITLAAVPKATFANRGVTANMGKHAWSASFNLACWLRVEYAIQSPIRLKLLYRDSRGWQQVFVDEGFINTHNRILLAGTAHIRALGPILDMKVSAAGISSVMNVSAEELFVQKIKEFRSQKNSPAEAA